VSANGPEAEGLTVDVPQALVEVIAERAAGLIAERTATAEEDGWLRGAKRIAAYLDAPRSRIYALANCKPPRIPIHRDGSNLIARRSELDSWVREGGDRRP